MEPPLGRHGTGGDIHPRRCTSSRRCTGKCHSTRPHTSRTGTRCNQTRADRGEAPPGDARTRSAPPADHRRRGNFLPFASSALAPSLSAAAAAAAGSCARNIDISRVRPKPRLCICNRRRRTPAELPCGLLDALACRRSSKNRARTSLTPAPAMSIVDRLLLIAKCALPSAAAR